MSRQEQIDRVYYVLEKSCHCIDNDVRARAIVDAGMGDKDRFAAKATHHLGEQPEIVISFEVLPIKYKI